MPVMLSEFAVEGLLARTYLIMEPNPAGILAPGVIGGREQLVKEGIDPVLAAAERINPQARAEQGRTEIIMCGHRWFQQEDEVNASGRQKLSGCQHHGATR